LLETIETLTDQYKQVNDELIVLEKDSRELSEALVKEKAEKN